MWWMRLDYNSIDTREKGAANFQTFFTEINAVALNLTLTIALALALALMLALPVFVVYFLKKNC